MSLLKFKQQNPHVNLDVSNLWCMTIGDSLRSTKTTEISAHSVGSDVMQVVEHSDHVQLNWSIDQPVKMDVSVALHQLVDHWQITAAITNHDAEKCIREFKWLGLQLRCDNASLLFPQGAGRRVTDFENFKPIDVQYPSYQCSMPWLAMDHASNGVYVGMHDPQDHCVDFALMPTDDCTQMQLALTHFPFVMSGKTVTLSPLIIKSYDGHWSHAAKFYRNWFDSVGKVVEMPKWMKTNSGWLLAILKQQNESVNYDYITGIDELADIAIARGLDTLGLFGWTTGGHDHLYPHYDPDPTLGGCDGLKAAIKRAKDRGLRVILYANGVIMDVATPFYREHGKDACSIMADGRVNISQIIKFTDATPVIFATACPCSTQWRKQMLSLAVQAQELGADGLLYDQIGVYGGHECHHPDHGHENPMDGYATGRVEMIREITNYMKQIDDQFIIATEGCIAPMARELHMIHGFGYAYGLTHFGEGNELFPDMLRMTFPQVVSTNRIPHALMDRNVAHYAVMHGFRQELEIRYLDDVKLCRAESLDWQTAYQNAAGSPPKKDMLQVAIAADEKNEMAKLMAFVKRNGDVFYHGTYQSDLGFTIESNQVLGRSYVTADNQLTVVLCNLSSQASDFALSVPGYSWIKTDSPTGALNKAVTSLDAQSICLMKFQKNQ